MPTLKQSTYNPYHQPNPEAIISLNREDESKKKPIIRRTVDYHTTIINYLETRSFQRTFNEFTKIYPNTNAIRHMRPIPFEKNNESHGYCTKYVSTSINKHKCAVNCLIWSPEGRRLITGNAMGQFTLWNGLKFNFDTILPAHEYPIRRMIWKYDSEILISSDSRGYIKYWTSNLKNLLIKKCHDESINDLCFSPTYLKFASASADGYVKIFDFSSCSCENNMKQHGWDVTCIDWHSSQSLIISGSKDNLIKMWDPRTSVCIKSLHGHKNTVSTLAINKINGNWLISGSKDQLIKIWDLRKISVNNELDTIRPSTDELSSLSWHPFYESLFVSGGKSGDIKYWKIGNSNTSCCAEIHKAHEQIIWDFAWHPLGHILASSSNDQTTRFWTRNRPGDTMNDQYNVNQLVGKSKLNALRQLAIATKHNPLGTGRTSNKPLIEIGGINLEEIINTEYDDTATTTAPTATVTSNIHVHPERMKQMNNMLPGMPNNIITPTPIQNYQQQPLPRPPLPQPQQPHPQPQQPHPQPHHHHHHRRHPYPIQSTYHHPVHQQIQAPPPPPPPLPPRPHLQAPPIPSSYHHQHQQLPLPPQNQSLTYNNNNNNDRDRLRYRDRTRGDRNRMRDRDRDRIRYNNNNNNNRRDRSRSRDRDRKLKKGSTVPGLARIFGK